MKPIAITIARQYGSGGRTIGEMLAAELGWPVYHKEIITKASEESGISEQLFAQADERVKKSLFGFGKKTYEGELVGPDSNNFTSEGNLFNIQAKIIKDLADQGNCVFVGRCADYILKDRENVVSIYIHASDKFNCERTMEKLCVDEKEATKYFQRVNKEREEYYKRFTGRDWTNADHYDLCLNSEVLGFEKCKEVVKEYLRVRFGESL